MLLPGTMTVAAPAIILASGDGPDFGWGLGALATAGLSLLGLAFIGAGLALWAWTARLLARIGKGTLAPWDPTRRLVVAGPYAHVRNPMITGVSAVLLGEAVLFGSRALLILLGVFVLVNWVFFILHEEPALERRFGEEYGRYKAEVPRWLPRRTPWRSLEDGARSP